MLDKYQQIIIFSTVAEELSFSKAAEKLDISKSQVSKQVRALEDRLNCQLVQRTTRAISLTEMGNKYAEHGRHLVETFQIAENAVLTHNEEVSGTLRIGIARSIGSKHIISLAHQFHNKFPNVELEIKSTDSRPDLIGDNLDCWIAIYEHSALPESMVAKKLSNCRFNLVASPDYLKKHGTPSTPLDLGSHNCIVYQGKERKYNRWEFSKGDEKVTVYAHGNLRLDDASSIFEATIAGVGIGYIATFLLSSEIEQGQLINLLPSWNLELNLPIYAVYPRRKHLAPKVRQFVDFMCQYTQSEVF
ncbi:LysR family transcriptional regulator [Vibrio hangzhouensis]|uniref:LysR family transcriptional regulator n=1 Tax=Vibrio hangzhouensis TaxID=462991 RepID=UPI001C98B9A9|nr:LysR family transcriptional regulator [Vibrio hangzhouensis]MBY6195977.1 LysR family transcriptional regulator [Vibrio hangzhouensis]